MSEVSPLPLNASALYAAGRLDRDPTRDQRSATDAPVRRGEDQVEVSAMATYLNKLKGLPALRQELVDRIRGEIARGAYDTPEKLDAALDDMIRDYVG